MSTLKKAKTAEALIEKIEPVKQEAVTHFDVIAPVKDAGFPEEPGPEHTPLVQQVRHWISILQSSQHTCNLLKAPSPVNCTGSPQGFSLVQIFHK